MRGHKRSKSYFEHCFCVLENIIVPEAQNTIATRFKVLRSSGIVRGVLLMLAAIRLDYQAALVTHEINDERAKGLLAAKLEVAESTMA